MDAESVGLPDSDYLKELGKITNCEQASERWPNQKKEEQVSIFNEQ